MSLAEEDPWRYCYNFCSPNEPFSFIVNWLAKQHEVASWKEPAVVVAVVAVEEIIPMHDKGKRNISDYI